MNLILYYSRKGENYVNGKIENLPKGNSEICAESLKDILGGDLFKIETVKPYSTDYTACTQEALAEYKASARPTLKTMLTDVSGYDNIIVCGPCWWGTYPMAVFTQLDALDLSGKNLYLIMTHEGSGLGHAQRDIQKMYPEAAIIGSLAIHGADAAKSHQAITNWATQNIY